MSDMDTFVTEQLIPFREKLVATLQEKHPFVLSVVDTLLGNKNNKFGMQIVDKGAVAGEYTFQLNGIRIEHTEIGKLEPAFHHPFLGIIRPYIIVEKSTLDAVMADSDLQKEPLAASGKYLPGITVKFLKS